MTGSHRSTIAGILGCVTLLTAGCGGGGDRAGGTGAPQSVVLKMAQANDAPPDQLATWANEVATRSNGTLRIEFVNLWREGETNFEQGIIKDVQSGQADLAWAGARAFDSVGVTTFQPLLAPLLVDSEDLQGAVFKAGIPAQMLRGLDDLHVTGLGVLPGPLRKIMGLNRAFVRPTDFSGTVVGIQASTVATEVFGVLGATVRNLPVGAALDGLDAIEMQLSSIAGNHYALKGAHFVSANVNMWPRPLVMFMNTTRFESLTDDQQSALRDSTDAVLDQTLAESRAEDSDAVPQLCKQGMTFTMGSKADLTALRAAFEPVYQQIGKTPANQAWLDKIVQLKNDGGVPPDAAQCPASQPTPAATTNQPAADELPKASFRSTITPADWANAGLTGYATGTYTFTIDDTDVTIVEPGNSKDNIFVGAYTVLRDRIEVSAGGGDMVTARWSFDGQQLTFTDVTPTRSPFSVVWESHPWTLVP